MNDCILEFTDIYKSFFGVRALRDVTLGLQRGHVLGLIGENGAGKSTLMNILGGVIQPDRGAMRLRGKTYAPRSPADATNAGIAFIHQELNLFGNLSIADNIFIDRFPRISYFPFIDRREVRRRTAKLLDCVDLRLSPKTVIEKLAAGERQLIEIAKALGFGAEIIIFDEPTTSLTARETKRLFGLIERLREQEKSIIYVSHNLSDVLRLADDVLVLRDGQVVQAGIRSEFTVAKMIACMVGREIEQLYPPKSSRPGSQVVLAVEGLSQSGVIKDVNFDLHKGEILGLFGLMGSGRTELARILFGLDSFQHGKICVNGKLRERRTPIDSIEKGMAFVTEDRCDEGLQMEATIADNISLPSLRSYARRTMPRFVARRRLLEAAEELSDSLRIKSGPVQKHLAKNLSGGNQQKVVLGKWLMAQPSVFIMDEPTRGIDVGAKYEVYTIINRLAAKGAGLLCISSELEELMGICDRILVMGNGQIQGCFAGPKFDEQQILHAAFREAFPGTTTAASGEVSE